MHLCACTDVGSPGSRCSSLCERLGGFSRHRGARVTAVVSAWGERFEGAGSQRPRVTMASLILPLSQKYPGAGAVAAASAAAAAACLGCLQHRTPAVRVTGPSSWPGQPGVRPRPPSASPTRARLPTGRGCTCHASRSGRVARCSPAFARQPGRGLTDVGPSPGPGHRCVPPSVLHRDAVSRWRTRGRASGGHGSWLCDTVAPISF